MRCYCLIVMIGAVSWLVGCPPYSTVKGPAYASAAFSQPVFDAAGVRLSIVVVCKNEVVEHWCRETEAQCRPQPVVTEQRPIPCPTKLTPADIWVRAPWGMTYDGKVTFATGSAGRTQSGLELDIEDLNRRSGIVTIPVDWKSSGTGATGSRDAAGLRNGWIVHYGQNEVRLALSKAEVTSLLALLPPVPAVPATRSVAPAGDSVSRPGQVAALAAKLSNQTDANGVNQIIVSVTNRGPDPAYKVAARLKSSASSIHGAQLAFGVVASGETTSRSLPISITNSADDLNPTVVAEVSASNAPVVSTSGRLRLIVVKRTPLEPLQLSCAALEKEGAPAQRLRIQCESSNPNDKPVRGVSFQVAIGRAAVTSITAPAELVARAHFKFEFAAIVPADAKPKSSLPITIMVRVPDAAPVQQQLAIRIVEQAGICKRAKLSREDYQAWRKKLQSALAAKSITQGEFDTYDAEQVACLE